MRKYHRGEEYTNGTNTYTLDGIWYNKGEIVRVELKNKKNGKVYEYQIVDFESALRDGKLIYKP